jgi:hypothetical protein
MQAFITGSFALTGLSLRNPQPPRLASRARAGRGVAAVAFLACLCPGITLAQYSAMWGTVPPQADGFDTYFADPVSACAYQHAYYSPPTAFYGATPLNGDWWAYQCEWQFAAGYSYPSATFLYCVDSSGYPANSNYKLGVAPLVKTDFSSG